MEKLKGYNTLDVIIKYENYLKLWKYRKLYHLTFLFYQGYWRVFENPATLKRIYFETNVFIPYSD